jgi:hypothetical protein
MSRDELIARITAASSPKPVKVQIDGLGEVFVRVMTAWDSHHMRKQLAALEADDGCEEGRLLACLLCDEGGTLLFDVNNAESVLMLAKIKQSSQARALKAASAANGDEPGKS